MPDRVFVMENSRAVVSDQDPDKEKFGMNTRGLFPKKSQMGQLLLAKKETGLRYLGNDQTQ